MVNGVRSSGIDIIGDVLWGSHFCQFYQTGEDLLDILVPYFKAGLDNNEYCMWVTAHPVNESDAKHALEKAVPSVDRYIDCGQLEIIPHNEWYLKGGSFDQPRVLNGWVGRLDMALAKGFDGLRLTGNTFWLEKEDWRSFTDYEQAVDSVISQFQMIALCTYSLERCGASEIADVISNHQFALLKRQGKWEAIASAERKRAEEALRESEAKYRDLTERISDIFVAMDRDFRYIYWNKASEQLTGIPAGNAIGKSLYELFPDVRGTDRDRIYLDALRMQRSQSEVIEYVLGDKLGFFEINAYPSREGLSVIVRDITERKQAEEERERLLNELSAANKELGTFSYSVSHDLRAPLRHIDGFSKILLQEYADKLDEQGRQYLQFLREGSQRMDQLIEAMLKLSRATRAEMRRQAINLSEVVESIAAEVCKEQPERKAEFVVEQEVVANGDPQLLLIVLQNLLGNAWKFTSKRLVARIEFGVRRQHDMPVYFVKDNGAGFDMTSADKLFGAFQRLHRTEEFPGTGIGLATVQRIVHRHGGRVWAEGEVDKGATFYFTLE